jgi:hypothetical protein
VEGEEDGEGESELGELSVVLLWGYVGMKIV